MPFVTANGLAFHVQELGAGPPVVMLHGLLIGSLASWYLTAAPAVARDHRVLVYDLRGHGRSERAKTGYDVRTMSEDLHALVEPFLATAATTAARGSSTAIAAGTGTHALPPAPRVDLVGHSWGALVALRFALAHPDRVRRLALVEAPLPPSQMTELAAFLADDGARPERLLDALPAPLREAVSSGRRQAKRLIESLEFLILGSSLLADLRAEPDVSDAELARVACPTLLVYGDRSSCAPAGERLARVIPGARHEVLPGGHYLHLEARQRLAELLVEFLA